MRVATSLGLGRASRLAADPRVRVLGAGLACCGLEVTSAFTRGLLVDESPAFDEAEVTVLIVGGTVTDVLAAGLAEAWTQVPGPKAVVAFGACASTGGPYWDAPTVTKGASTVLEVAAFVPGCPPRPEALLDGISLAVESARGAVSDEAHR